MHYHKEEGNKTELTRITSIGVDAIALPRLAMKLELKQQILKLVSLSLTAYRLFSVGKLHTGTVSNNINTSATVVIYLQVEKNVTDWYIRR